MHIAFICPFLFRYRRGIERFCVHLSNRLVRMGQQVTIIAWGDVVPTADLYLDSKIRIAKVPYVRYFQSWWAIPFYIFELLINRYDVVNIFFAGYGEAEALTFARRFRPFQINFIVGYPIDLVPHRFKEFRRWGLDNILNRIIVKSHSMMSEIANFFKREVHMIPNGVDTEVFNRGQVDAEPLRRRFEIEQRTIVLLTVAALEERKGIQFVIRVLPDLFQAGFSIRYFVIGEGPYRGELEALTRRCNVTEYVHFVGAVPDVAPYYKLADIFILLSRGEGFPNVLLEAWSLELSAVVSKHPPYPDIVHPNLGFLIDEQSQDELKLVLTKLLASPAMRLEVGRNARNHVLNHYAWSIVAERYMDMFLNRS